MTQPRQPRLFVASPLVPIEPTPNRQRPVAPRNASFVYTGKVIRVLGENGLFYTARVVRPQTWAEAADHRYR